MIVFVQDNYIMYAKNKENKTKNIRWRQLVIIGESL